MQTFKATTDPRLNKKPIIESQNWLKKKKFLENTEVNKIKYVSLMQYFS